MSKRVLKSWIDTLEKWSKENVSNHGTVEIHAEHLKDLVLDIRYHLSICYPRKPRPRKKMG